MTQPAFDPAALAADFDDTAHHTPEEQRLIRRLADGIRFSDAVTVTAYGTKAQRDLGEYSAYLLSKASDSAQENARDAIRQLLEQINQIDIAALGEQKGFLGGLFSRKNRRLSSLRRDYARIRMLVDRLADKLDMARLALLKDIGLLDTMYQKNHAAYHDLRRHIAAGELALKEHAVSVSAEEQSPGQEDFEALFEQRLHQLRQSKAVSLQLAGQIRLTQHSQRLMARKLQESVDLAIPLWQNQLALALNIQGQQAVLKSYQHSAQTIASAIEQNRDALRDEVPQLSSQWAQASTELDRLKAADKHLTSLMEQAMSIRADADEQ